MDRGIECSTEAETVCDGASADNIDMLAVIWMPVCDASVGDIATVVVGDDSIIEVTMNSAVNGTEKACACSATIRESKAGARVPRHGCLSVIGKSADAGEVAGTAVV